MEYEYSFNVKDINAYLKFCEVNNFHLIKKVKQTITIYRNTNKTIARITVEEGDKTVRYLDFKEDKITTYTLNIRKESQSVLFEDYEGVISILNFLEYFQDNTLVRTRTIYQKDNIKLEIDEYSFPNSNYVIAIEGNKKNVDLIYQQLESLNNQYMI